MYLNLQAYHASFVYSLPIENNVLWKWWRHRQW